MSAHKKPTERKDKLVTGTLKPPANRPMRADPKDSARTMSRQADKQILTNKLLKKTGWRAALIETPRRNRSYSLIGLLDGSHALQGMMKFMKSHSHMFFVKSDSVKDTTTLIRDRLTYMCHFV